jgi:hypothetical protein
MNAEVKDVAQTEKYFLTIFVDISHPSMVGPDGRPSALRVLDVLGEFAESILNDKTGATLSVRDKKTGADEGIAFMAVSPEYDNGELAAKLKQGIAALEAEGTATGRARGRDWLSIEPCAR